MPKRERKYKDGELLSLTWDCTPDEVYVVGHVTPEQFNEALTLYHGEGEFEPVTAVLHAYGRWSVGYTDDGPGQVLATHAEPGPGRFRLTIVPYEVPFPSGTCKECGTATEYGVTLHRRCAKSACARCSEMTLDREMTGRYGDGRFQYLCPKCYRETSPIAWVLA